MPFPKTLWTALLLLAAAAAQSRPGQVVRTLKCPGPCPTGLAAAGERLWVVDRFTDRIYGLDRATGELKREFRAPCCQPYGLACDGKGRLWVGSDLPEFGADRLYRLDPATGLVTAQVPLPLDSLRSLAWQEGALWAGTGEGKLVRVDPLDGSVLRESPAPSERLNGLAWDGRRLWSCDRRRNRIYPVDPATGEVLFALPAPGPHLSGLAWAGGFLYALDYEKRLIYEIAPRGEKSWWTADPRRRRLCYRIVMHNRGGAPAPKLTAFIAVPKDTVKQKLLEPPRWVPEPAGFEEDEWGVRFARFDFDDVAPGATVEARLHLDLEIRSLRRAIYPEQVQGLDRVPAEIRKRYLQGGNKYQLQNPYLRKLVKESVGEEKNPWWIARKLARTVGERMQYELAGGWEPAPVVLERGSGSCSEYTFAFLALCRIAGLPARYVGAVCVRGDEGSCDETFHRWAQVYLPGPGWVDWDVQAADAKLRGRFAESLCYRSNAILTTTYGGGPSRILRWEYNGQTEAQCRGRADILVEKYGEWSPLPR